MYACACMGVTPAGVAALVFGREESGLTEDELRMCAHACAIPTGRLQPSMNLSHAVAVVLAFAFERRLQLLGLSDLGVEDPGRRSDTATRASTQPAAHSELAALLDKLSAIATAAGVSGEDSRGGGAQGRHGRRRLPVGHARALLGRSAASTAEVRALHGLASSVLAALQPGAGDPKDSIGGLDEGRHDTGGT
jgi:tRNA C32,U32 (ribose-2'-O)-methylase TrmJ